MKRQRRDTSERAYKNGFNSGFKGHSQDICPYHESVKRELWLSGWREGWDSYKNSA